MPVGAYTAVINDSMHTFRIPDRGAVPVREELVLSLNPDAELRSVVAVYPAAYLARSRRTAISRHRSGCGQSHLAF